MKRVPSPKRKAFTLIELLIVVAIIAILAAIAVPNFLEAQTRSKVSRVKSDIRTLLTGLEAYAVDYNKFPDIARGAPSASLDVWPVKLGGDYSRRALRRVSTPIAYLTSGYFEDPFAKPGSVTIGSITANNTEFVGYANALACEQMDLAAVMVSATDEELGRFRAHGFVVQSVGPDSINYALHPDYGFPRAFQRIIYPTGAVGQDFIYDPTNGTISTGDVVRTRELNFN